MKGIPEIYKNEVPCDRQIKSSTLCYIEKNGCYLMMHRVVKKNDINHDKWIGVGGHFEEGESAEECLRREVFEETKIRLEDYRYRGLVTFVPHEGSIELMYLYTAFLPGDKENISDKIPSFDKEAAMGEPDTVKMEEGILEWVPKEKISSLEIWEGDKLFFSVIEEDRDFENMLLVYDSEGRLVKAKIEENDIRSAR